jgi:hypothetical protein
MQHDGDDDARGTTAARRSRAPFAGMCRLLPPQRLKLNQYMTITTVRMKPRKRAWWLSLKRPKCGGRSSFGSARTSFT